MTSVQRLPADQMALSEVSVQSARRGAPVTLFGTGFDASTTVAFNGVVAAPTSATANRIVVKVPSTATTGPLTISNSAVSVPGGNFRVDTTPAPVITTVTPSIVNPGGSFTLTGTGFATAAAEDVVYVGGTQAVVTEASATSLKVQVPPFRASGRITLRTQAGLAVSPTVLTQAPAPYIAADVGWTGRLTAGATTAVVVPATKIAVATLEMTGSQRTRLTIAANTFTGCVDVRVLAPGGQPAWRSSCAAAGDSSPTLTPTTDGTFVVLVDPHGSAGSLSLAPKSVTADATRSLTMNAAASPLTVTAGQRAVFTFAGVAQQRVAAAIDWSWTGCTDVRLVSPTGAPLYALPCGGGGEQRLPTATLPTRGTYRIIVDADGEGAGTANAAVRTVPVDAKTPLTLDGPVSSVITTNSGQRATFTFGGTAGSRVFIHVTSQFGSRCPDVTLRGPDQIPVASSAEDIISETGNCTSWLDTVLLARPGDYELVVDPKDLGHGQVSARALLVPADVVLASAADGTSRTVTTVAGQGARVTFVLAAGDHVALTATPTWAGDCPMEGRLLDPSGTEVGRSACGANLGFQELVASDAGTYTLALNPAADSAGSTAVRIFHSTEATAAATVDLGSVSVVTGLAQTAVVSFTTSVPRVFITLHDTYASNGCTTYDLVDTAGRSLASAGCFTADGFIDTTSLATPGTYRVLIDPAGAATGASTVTLTSVPADSTAAGSVAGPAVTLSTTKPGQGARLTFTGAAAQRIRVTTQATTYSQGPTAELLDPTGASIDAGTLSMGNPWDVVLDAAGLYTVVVDPYGGDTGSVRVALSLTPAPATLQFAPPDDSATEAGRESDASPGTALTGTVRDQSGRPLPGVTLRIEANTAITNASGNFELRRLPAGTRSLVIDGRTVAGPLHYGVFRTPVHLQPHQRNRLGFTSYLGPLDTAHEVPVVMPLQRDVVIMNPDIPGLEVRLSKGSMVLDADGRPVSKLGITRVPLNRTPIPLPRGVAVPIFWTIQPAGGSIDGPPARVVYPNLQHLPPGARVNFWHNDAAPDDLDGWQTYGHGTVDANGTQIRPDYAARIRDFDGAMINIPDQPPADDAPPPCQDGSCGDPVDPATGLFTLHETDLALPDILPLTVARGYNSADTHDRAFGIGGNDIYSAFISSDTDELTSDSRYADAEVNFNDGRQVRFARVSPGTSFDDAIFQAVSTPSAMNRAVLAWNGDGFDVTTNEGIVSVHGDHMPLQQIRDIHGNVVTIAREFTADSGRGVGNVVDVRSPNGRWVHYDYDATGKHVVAAMDSSGRSTTYSYDASGHLTTVTDPMGQSTVYGYSAQGRISTIKDKRGFIRVTNTYDSSGRVTRQVYADGGQYTFNYNLTAAGAMAATLVTDSAGVVHRHGFDGYGFLTSVTDALGTPFARTMTMLRDPMTHAVTRITDPLGRAGSITYDADGNITAVTRASGTSAAVTTRATFVGSPLPGRQDTTVDGLGHVTRYTYDDHGNLTRLTDPMGRVWNATYTRDGTQETVQDGTLAPRRYIWASGMPLSVTDPLGHVTRTTYDSAGRGIAVTDAAGAAHRLTFDRLNRPLTSTSPLGSTLKAAYDASGNLIRVTDALGHSTAFAYDSMDRPVTRTDALGAVEETNYDPAGRPTASTDRRGLVTEYAYDGLSRLQRLGYGRTGATPPYAYQSTLALSYNASDELLTVADSASGSGTISYSYDALGRATGESRAGQSVAYVLNAADHRIRTTASGFSPVEYVYDASGRLTAVKQGANTATHTYDNMGRATSGTLPGGVTVTRTFDDASRLTQLEYAATGRSTPLLALEYHYDELGRRYGDGGSSAGTNLPSAVGSATYDAMNRLTSRDGSSFGFDADGNLLTSASSSYQWNARGELVATTLEGQTTTLAYDGVGRLDSTTVGGLRHGFRYDGTSMIGELEGPAALSQLVASYMNAPGLDQAITRTSSGGTQTMLTDVQGTVLALTEPASPELGAQYSYEPFGRATSTVPSDPNPLRYTGKPTGPGMPPGLQYNRHRFYSPDQQRFVSEDPSGFNGGDANLYAYVGNHPVDATDPSGLGESFSNWFNGCNRLEQTINNLRKQVMEKSQEWEANEGIGGGGALPQCHPNGSILPLWSTRGGHAVSIEKYKSDLRAAEKNYSDKCGGPPPTPQPVVIYKPAPSSTNSGSSSSDAATGAAAVGATMGAGALVWWLAKGLSPVCGPALPVCAVVF
ncbi:RHS repeat-associated core domain-containing protein [Knoellia alttitudinis]